MRQINFIAVHTTATPQSTTVASIQKYWREVLGWKSPGYHYIIDRFGIETQLQDESKIANGVKGHNHDSIHVSYIGGVENGKPKDNRTPEQKASLIHRLEELKRKYPAAVIKGHRDFLIPGKPGWKDCPCFSAKEEYFYL